MKFWLEYGTWIRVVPLLVMTLLFCSGCWDKKELNQLALAQVIAIDYKDSQYQTALQLIIPSADKETVTSDNLWTMTGTGTSVGETMQQIALAAPREIYLDHLDLVILGDGVLRHDVGQALDYLLKENVLRRRTRLLAVEGDAGKLLSDSAELAKMDIFYMDNLLKDQRRRVHSSDAIVNAYFLSAHNGLAETIVIPHLVLEEKKELRLEGAALVRDGALADWADKDWLSGYYWTVGGSEIMTLPDEYGQIVVELDKKKCKWEIQSEEPLQIKATLRAVIKIISGYDSWRDSAEAEKVIHSIQTRVEEQALEHIRDTFQQAQKDGTDVFHMGRWLYAWHPELVHADKWPEQFAAMPVVFEINTSIEIQ
ncbi:MAG: Ger(x)C family spore germination protein [Peptococcaceae bacterium]|nr:Ger(x)C family spore germination protein [Peptococcaceae bacterium]